jgi:ubiquinone/menaquinone biosynthesis C-methylase UbiE
MNISEVPKRYTGLQSWAHDHLIAGRALKLHAHILEHTGLAEILAEQRERTVLDVGCGGGQALLRMNERYPHLRLTGVDLSADQITRARQRARRKGCVLQLHVADAQALPLADGSFDVVFSFGSAKHWPDPLKGVSECWRVLKAGGELLVADATSDATMEDAINFYRISGFPRLLQKPITAILYNRMFRPALPVETYRRIAVQLEMPPGTVSQLPSMPAFLFRTRKPQATS